MIRGKNLMKPNNFYDTLIGKCQPIADFRAYQANDR